MFPYVSYQGRVFTSPAARVVLFGHTERGLSICATPPLSQRSIASPAAFPNPPQPTFIPLTSDLVTPGIIKTCCCLLHNPSQAENNPDKMTKMSSHGDGLRWRDLSSPEGSYLNPVGTAQGRWKLVLASLPSQLKEIFYLSVFVFLFRTSL